MTIAKGRSCILAELDILKETLENMINTIESQFRDYIDCHKAHIFDFEHDTSIEPEERANLTDPHYDELRNYSTQRNISRNKLVICIYSICEATLASICKDYNLKLVKEPNPNLKPKRCPHLNGRECDVKNNNHTNYYLNDYLYTINHNYSTDWEDAHIVSTSIKNLRNYLTHSKADVKRAAKIIQELSNNQFNHISQINGEIIIRSAEDIKQILNQCYGMLVHAEQEAKLKKQK